MWLKRLIIGLYSCLFVIVPLIMSTQTSEMFEIPKMLTVYVFTTGIIAAYLVGVALRVWMPRYRIVGYLLFLWVLTQGLATFFSIDWYTSVFGYYGRYNGGLLSTVMYAALIYIGIQIFDRQNLKLLWFIALLTGCMVLIWGLPGRLLNFDLSCYVFRGEWTISCWTDDFRPHERMFSTLGQPNWLGTYFAVLVLAAYGLAQQVTQQWKRYVMYGMSIFLSLGLWFTGSRSAQLGLLIGAALLLARYLSSKLSKRVFLSIATIIVAICIGIGGWYVRSLVRISPGSITHSGSIRLIVWEGAIKLFARYPLLGTGPETFAYAYPLTRPARHNLTTEKDFIYNKAHNEFLNILASSGVVGFSGYILLIGSALYISYQKKRYALTAAMVALHVANFLGFSTSNTQLLLVLLLTDSFARLDTLVSASRQHLSRWTGRSILAAVISLVLVGLATLSAYQYWLHYIVADIYYARALSESQSGQYLESLSSYQRAYRYRAEHLYENRFALVAAQAASTLASQMNEEITITYDDVESLERLALLLQTRALSRSPSNPVYWRDRAKLGIYLSSIATDEAQIARYHELVDTSIAQAQKLAPTDLSLAEIRGLIDTTE